jgi:hypothetical protein
MSTGNKRNNDDDDDDGSNSVKKKLFQSTAKAKNKREKHDDTPNQGGRRRGVNGEDVMRHRDELERNRQNQTTAVKLKIMEQHQILPLSNRIVHLSEAVLVYPAH